MDAFVGIIILCLMILVFKSNVISGLQTLVGRQGGNIDHLNELSISEGFSGDRNPQMWDPTIYKDENNKPEIYDNYQQGIIHGLNPEIQESHDAFVKDSDFQASMGASRAVTRDDFSPPVKFHGLPRPGLYAVSGSDKSARVAQSETREDVSQLKEFGNTGYWG